MEAMILPSSKICLLSRVRYAKKQFKSLRTCRPDTKMYFNSRTQTNFFTIRPNMILMKNQWPAKSHWKSVSRLNCV